MGAKVKFKDGFEFEVVEKHEAVAIMQNGLQEVYVLNLHDETESLLEDMKALYDCASFNIFAIEGDNRNWVGLDGVQS